MKMTVCVSAKVPLPSRVQHFEGSDTVWRNGEKKQTNKQQQKTTTPKQKITSTKNKHNNNTPRKNKQTKNSILTLILWDSRPKAVMPGSLSWRSPWGSCSNPLTQVVWDPQAVMPGSLSWRSPWGSCCSPLTQVVWDPKAVMPGSLSWRSPWGSCSSRRLSEKEWDLEVVDSAAWDRVTGFTNNLGWKKLGYKKLAYCQSHFYSLR